jgi:hypothetical protein
MSRYNDELRFIEVPTITVHNDEIYLYGKKEYIKDKFVSANSSIQNLQLNYNHNQLSKKAKGKAKRAIKYLLYNSAKKTFYNPKTNSTYSFNVNFITLTLSSPQIHTDKEIIHSCLNQFFIEAKNKWNLEKYVWKKEYQENGRVHFHILTNVWIPWQELRNVWNRIQNKLGYLDRYEEIRFKKNPNSTDVHSLRKIKNVPAYILKYMTKEQKKRRLTVSRTNYPQQYPQYYHKNTLSIGTKKFLGQLSQRGRIWTCSHSLSNLTGGVSEINPSIMREIELLEKEQGSRRIDKDFFSGIYFTHWKLNSKKYPLLYSLLSEFIETKFTEKKDQKIYNVGSAPP